MKTKAPKANQHENRNKEEETEGEEEEEEIRESLRAEDLSLFGKTWMVLDSWVTKSTFLLVGNDRNGSIEHYRIGIPGGAQLAARASEGLRQSINRILGGRNTNDNNHDAIITSNKKLHCERDLALMVRTFDFGTTVSLPKWPSEAWDFVTALIF